MDTIVQFSENNGIGISLPSIPPVGTNLMFENDAHLYEVTNVTIFVTAGKTTVQINVEKC